jgi:hypothetical protein
VIRAKRKTLAGPQYGDNEKSHRSKQSRSISETAKTIKWRPTRKSSKRPFGKPLMLDIGRANEIVRHTQKLER